MKSLPSKNKPFEKLGRFVWLIGDNFCIANGLGWRANWVAISEFDGMHAGMRTREKQSFVWAREIDCGVVDISESKMSRWQNAPRIGDLCTSYVRNNSLNGNQCMSNCKRISIPAAPAPSVRRTSVRIQRADYKAKSIRKCKNLLRKQSTLPSS